MKKITYTLQFALVGSINSGKDTLVDYLKKNSINSGLSTIENKEKRVKEYLLVFKDIPMKIRLFMADNLNQIIYDYNKIGKLDSLILTLNLHNLKSLETYNIEALEEFYEYFLFRGLTVLVGVQKDFSSLYRIRKEELVKKAKELDILYCFELNSNENTDIEEFYDKILNDFFFKFQFSSPELFERAKEYGIKLLKQMEYPKLVQEEIKNELKKEEIIAEPPKKKREEGPTVVGIEEPIKEDTEESYEEIVKKIIDVEQEEIDEEPIQIKIRDYKIVSIDEKYDAEMIWRPKEDIIDESIGDLEEIPSEEDQEELEEDFPFQETKEELEENQIEKDQEELEEDFPFQETKEILEENQFEKDQEELEEDFPFQETKGLLEENQIEKDQEELEEDFPFQETKEKLQEEQNKDILKPIEDLIEEKSEKFEISSREIPLKTLDTSLDISSEEKKEKIITIKKKDGRRTCPSCGNHYKMLIHEAIDKTNIILSYPRLYGKKFRCGQCGCVWRER